jgi:hypothetical protein
MLVGVDIRVVVTTEHYAVISNTQQCIANIWRHFTATTPRSLRANAALPGGHAAYHQCLRSTSTFVQHVLRPSLTLLSQVVFYP